ncbi:hypothetical protein EV361DRAFT_869770 [Lentinula raphanica]|nr:hypothetical protein EV361DRAFT_869770 [Lentinula raphanica]
MAEKWYPKRDPQHIHVTGQAERDLLSNDVDEELDPDSAKLFIDALVEQRNEIRRRLALDCAPYEAAFLEELRLKHSRCYPHEPLTADKLQTLRTVARRQAEVRVYQLRADRSNERTRAEARRRAEVCRMERKWLREKEEAKGEDEEDEEDEEASLL